MKPGALQVTIYSHFKVLDKTLPLRALVRPLSGSIRLFRGLIRLLRTAAKALVHATFRGL
jgi:hypothetical protein